MPTIEQLKEGLLGSFRSSDWYFKIRMYLNGNDFEHILQEILRDRMLGYRITPKLKYIFKPFMECPFEKTRVVFHTTAPSPFLNRADGLAFSQSVSNRADKTLEMMFEEIKNTINPKYKGACDLDRWAKQGVLLTNASLTTIVDNMKMPHLELWNGFTNRLFEAMQDLPENTIFILVGEEVWHREQSIKHKDVIKVHAPTSRLPESWGSNVFNKINELIDADKIIW